MKARAMSVWSHVRVAARLEKARGPIAWPTAATTRAPRPLRARAEEGQRPDRLAPRGHPVTDAVVLELLRGGALLVDVVALALPEGRVHAIARHVHCPDRSPVQAALVAGVLEHG